MYKDKIIFITGASNGIGKALAEGYANKGAKVIATDIIEGKFDNSNIHFYKMDLKNKDDITNVFESVVKTYGKIHILINNGAISKFNKSIFDIEVEEFDEVISVNLRGAFICSKEFLNANRNEGYGRIINIASTRYNQNEAGWEAYGASKGGLVSLTNTMAISLSETPITVNAISPGWIEVKEYDLLSEEDHKQHPSGRVGREKDILSTCLFLTHEDNDFVNGENIIVDGGMTKKMIYV